MLSVILPIYNEEQGLHSFLVSLLESLRKIPTDFEVLLVDDGSTDTSMSIIKDYCSTDNRFRYISLSRNFGHQIAITAGIEHATGDAIVLMDSDGQDPPEEIIHLWNKLNTGFDIVYAKRTTREDESFIKKQFAKIFYKFLNRVTSIDIPLDTGDFRIFNTKVKDALLRMPEKQRYLRGQIAWLGFKSSFITYDRKGRIAGETHYTYRKMFRLAIDAVTSFSNWPLRMATLSGFVCAAIGFVLILYTLYSRLVLNNFQPGWASIMITVLFLGGIQLLTIGVIGEYIGKINDNVKNRPLYLIQETNINTKSDTSIKENRQTDNRGLNASN